MFYKFIQLNMLKTKKKKKNKYKWPYKPACHAVNLAYMNILHSFYVLLIA